jgi:hypothetical protein
MPDAGKSPSVVMGIIARREFQAAYLSQRPEKVKEIFRFVI